MIYFYSIEIALRFIYVIISFILCGIISIYSINWLLLLIIYPFLKLFTKKFIITHVTDFLDVIWVLMYSVSFLFVLPLVFYHILNFFKSGWYIYQINILRNFFYWLCATVNAMASLCYLIILPATLNFLICWEKLGQSDSILTIETEFQILNFVCWILNFQYSFSFLVSFYLAVVMLLWVSLKVDKTYFVVKLYRKQFSFISLLFLFILSPSEIFLQFFTIFFTILFYEVVFFFVCYKISNSN